MQVDKNNLVSATLAQLSRSDGGAAVLLQPFKKDRALCVIRCHDGYHVLERGFARQDFNVDEKKIRKLLKKLCRKEFPRSHKVWLTRCTEAEIRERYGAG
ncbi:MAG: hypothetical protein ABFR63_07385 [Thermodesulfobacteriota bacterium]